MRLTSCFKSCDDRRRYKQSAWRHRIYCVVLLSIRRNFKNKFRTHQNVQKNKRCVRFASTDLVNYLAIKKSEI